MLTWNGRKLFPFDSDLKEITWFDIIINRIWVGGGLRSTNGTANSGMPNTIIFRSVNSTRTAWMKTTGDFLAEHCSTKMVSIDDLANRAVRFREYRSKRHFIEMLERWLYGNTKVIQFGSIGPGNWFVDFKGVKIKYLRVTICDTRVARQGDRNH